MRPITHIVIHCSASPNGRPVTVEDIDRWHALRGFHRALEWVKRINGDLRHIGYHGVIYVDGTFVTGRHVEEIGAHVAGSNARSIGICLVGTDRFTVEQWDKLTVVISALREQYPGAHVCGHRDFSPDKDGDGIVEPWEWLKTCPGFDVADWLANHLLPDAAHVLDKVNGQPHA